MDDLEEVDGVDVSHGSGHYVTEVGYEQAKFVATAMDHGGLLDWESDDHDKQTACSVAIAEATKFILGIRGFIACGAENGPEKEEPELQPPDEDASLRQAENTSVDGDPMSAHAAAEDGVAHDGAELGPQATSEAPPRQAEDTAER